MLAHALTTGPEIEPGEQVVLLPMLLLDQPSEWFSRCDLGCRARDRIRDGRATGRVSTRRKFAAIVMLNAIASLPVVAVVATIGS